ncbi:MAG: protein ImuB [Pseudonocardiales bacterium]|nr:protein ImuB [Pseudonocardiales bacterium]
MSEPAPRILALWCPDWPVVAAVAAAGVSPHRPAAVVAANRVLACSAVARAQGVRRGLRRREAQARCPELAVLDADPERDARLFEQVALAVEELAPGVEVVRPGLIALLAQGPVSYFGSTRSTAERLIDHVAGRTGAECQIGIADGLFAATLAAHRGVVVEQGRTEEFLGPLPVDELDREPGVDRAELIDLLRRLGLRSLGAFGRLPAGDVASRFGADAVLAHRLARGLDPRPPARRRPAEELAVAVELDPPVNRVDAAAFASRALAEQLHALLAGHGLACTRLGIQARTLDGTELYRVWRCAEPLTPAGTVDRVRWQLEAWLTRELIRRGAPVGEVGVESGGLRLLRLSGEEVVTAGALQLGLWGDVGAAGERAGRALVRVQAMLGPEGVFTAVLEGGRDPAERVRLVPWGDERPASDGESPTAGQGAGRRAGSRAGRRAGSGLEPWSEVPPWPGRLPAPSPTTVPAKPPAAEVWDGSGHPVRVTDRYVLTSVPAAVAVDGGRPVPVRGWAGPWPVDQRWWDTTAGWRGSRLQVVLGGSAGLGGEEALDVGAAHDGAGADESVERALLLLCRDGRWSVTGVYD